MKMFKHYFSRHGKQICSLLAMLLLVLPTFAQTLTDYKRTLLLGKATQLLPWA
ncbi:MAG: hypothetical protein ACKVTZ_04345 [Bacteroidia bacterium]